jgi:hypothetical protein
LRSESDTVLFVEEIEYGHKAMNVSKLYGFGFDVGCQLLFQAVYVLGQQTATSAKIGEFTPDDF